MTYTTDHLTERISVVYYQTARNSKGDIVKNLEVVRCNVWANVYPLTAKINDSEPARENEITYRITIRNRADILPDDVVIWRGRHLKITTPPVDLDNKHIWTQFNCRDVIQDGAYQ